MLGLLMNRWVLGGLAGLIMLGLSFWKGYVYGQNNVQQKWNAEKVVLEREAQELKDQAREAERNMQKEVNRIQRERHHAVKAADTKYNALINSLRDRSEDRDFNAMSDSSGDVAGCTGAGLARPDAEFLAGFAADAERLQAAYNSCRQAYEVIHEQRRQK
jgi:hypothetical protein